MAQSFKVKSKIQDFTRNTIVDDKNVLVRIRDWNFDPSGKETIIIEFDILSGLRKGIKLKDYVAFGAEDKMNWKYALLRAALGIPIPLKGEDEYDLIDMVGKYIVVNLVKSKDEKYQNINYVAASDDLLERLIDQNVEHEEEVEEVEEVKPSPNPHMPIAEPVKPAAPAKSIIQGQDVPAVNGEDDLPF